MCYTNYLVTPKGYYFNITEVAMETLGFEGLRVLEEAGCMFCLDEQSMYEKHIEVMNEQFDYEVEVEDIEGTYYAVQFLYGEYIYMDDRGFQCKFRDEDSDGIDVINSKLLAEALKEFEL